MKQNKTQKGFTLIELLMVVALIAILSTMILLALDSGREKAEVNRYIAYATQMHRLAAAAAAAGQFDSGKTTLVADSSVCLGDIGYDCGGASAVTENDGVYKALTYLTEMPETDKDNAFSPYNKSQGVFMTYRPSGTNIIRVFMYLLNDDTAFLTKTCNSINWGTSPNGYCYADIQLNSRL